MWQVWLSDYPGVVFVIVEDTGRASRAKVWKDWELSTKKWKKSKRRGIEARRKRQEEETQREAEKAQEQAKGIADSSIAATDDAQDPESKPAPQTGTASGADDRTEPMDVDVTSTTAPSAPVEKDFAADTPAAQQQPEAASSTTIDPPLVFDKLEDADEDIIESAGPKPKLRLPSHTRYAVSALTSSMSAMLTGLNLPPPHGAPVGTAGPGAWVPRGAAVSIEGLVLEINSQSLNALPGISPALASVSSSDEAATGSGAVDWRVRVGSVMGGGGRSAGAIVEAEFLPMSTLLPTSKFMHDFLQSLIPPGIVPVAPPVPVSGMPSAAASVNGTPRTNNATLPGMNGSNAANGPTAGGSGLSWTIGGGSGPSAPLNSNLSIPVVSDQLWEEVVPRSGEIWRKRIAKRSFQMRMAARAQRRQRRNANAPVSTSKADAITTSQNGDAFGWHTFDSDDDSPTPHANGDWQDENEDDLSSSDSDSDSLPPSSNPAAGGLAGTAVTMQQVDEDDDDDDDRPLGAPIWSAAANRNAAPNPAAPTPAVKKEETVQLIFQGLRPDERDAEGGDDGWTGVERGRRIAFQYVQMLRAEGII